MVIITVELPSTVLMKLHISETATLKELADELQIPNAIFFCSRFEGEVGTFMDYATNELFSKFNTEQCVVFDSTKIPEKDQATVKMWLELYESLSSLNKSSDQR